LTNLFDFTVQHVGWAGANFAAGGWEDWHAPTATGLIAGSYWAQSQNGVALDQALQLVEGDGTPPNSSSYWFNVHTAAAITGPTGQPGYLITPSTRAYTYTRVPHSNDAILWRAVISDQGTTPPPSSPP